MSAAPDLQWLDSLELRVGLGCMRLSTDADRDEESGLATIAEAVAAGVTVFDTARSYGLDATDAGHNERLLARGLRRVGGTASARIVTKGGMVRAGDTWVPDGRARTIRSDCEASLADLDGLEVDLYLLHAPDPRRTWSTSVRALARLLDEGLVRRIGVSNVNRAQLDEALALAPLGAVETALGPYHDRGLRSGVLERCVEKGIGVIAHSPFGGPRRAPSLARRQPFPDVARKHGATPAEVVLAWILSLAPGLVVVPGARRPETVRSAVRAAELELDADDRELIESALGRARRRGVKRRCAPGADVVVVMGIPGAGKSRVATEYAAKGYERLNRDERGGSLRGIASALDDTLASGRQRIVLDNTYLTRAARSHVLDVVSRHGLAARCVWLDTPLAQAQVNLVERLLDRLGSLPAPEELARLARHEPGILTPTSQMRTFRELEPPSVDEGFASVERVRFDRSPSGEREYVGIFVAAGALRGRRWKRAVAQADPGAAHLLFDWRPGGSLDELDGAARLLAAEVAGPVETAVCPHPAGPPTCWCRPPLPGLVLAFARTHAVDLLRSVVVGVSPTHRTLASALGARHIPV